MNILSQQSPSNTLDSKRAEPAAEISEPVLMHHPQFPLHETSAGSFLQMSWPLAGMQSHRKRICVHVHVEQSHLILPFRSSVELYLRTTKICSVHFIRNCPWTSALFMTCHRVLKNTTTVVGIWTAQQVSRLVACTYNFLSYFVYLTGLLIISTKYSVAMYHVS